MEEVTRSTGFWPAAVARAELQTVDLSAQHRGAVDLGLGRASYRKNFGKRHDLYGHEKTARKLSSAHPAFLDAVPEIIAEDVEAGVLLIAYVNAVATLRHLYAARASVGQNVLARLATAVGAMHAVHQVDLVAADRANQPVERQFVFALANPTKRLLHTASSGSIGLAKVLQIDSSVRTLIAQLESDWEPSTFIHNDLKWDNILIHPREGETERTQIKIIDWEMAGIGDPCWDVGTVLSEFLAFWALSIPMVADEPPDTYMHLAKYPLEDMHPAIGAFWHSYAETMGFNAATARDRLIKSTRYAGARLIQTAYERTQTMNQLTPQIYLLLQLSLNVMEGPEEAAEHLFGIPLPQTAR